MPRCSSRLGATMRPGGTDREHYQPPVRSPRRAVRACLCNRLRFWRAGDPQTAKDLEVDFVNGRESSELFLMHDPRRELSAPTTRSAPNVQLELGRRHRQLAALRRVREPSS